MLSFHSCTGRGQVSLTLEAKSIPPEIIWIDALRPDTRETAFLERVLGFEVPTPESLSGIESSNRLHAEKNWLHLTIPMIYCAEGFMPALTPLGFLLSKDLLLTVRFKRMMPFDDVKDHVLLHPAQPPGPAALIAILEVIINHTADLLEKVGSDLDRVSEEIIGTNRAHTPYRSPLEDNQNLRSAMRQIGGYGDLASKTEDLLLNMARMLPFVVANAAPYLSADLRAKLKSLQRDVASLNDYETHLTNKIHFLLDAILGLTNVEQNNIFRILTVVSVVGIPPTFFASMWGMNFKNIPEYDWAYGYQFGLFVIALSAIIPIIWFKWRGWW
jgi:magnesium transporter